MLSLGLGILGLSMMSWTMNWSGVILSLGGLCILVLSHYMPLGYEMVSIGVGVDWVSYLFVLLSLWVGALVFMGSVSIYWVGVNDRLYSLMMMCLVTSLVYSFMVMDYLYFYIWFEASVIFILLIIMGWGYQPERIQAGIYMFFYTLFGSLPLLISFISLYTTLGSTSMLFIYWSILEELIWCLFMLVAFLVKLPVIMAHLWLPKAHVEASVGGSMILAGVLLKLGGYGMIRVINIFLPVIQGVNLLLIMVGIWGGVLLGFVCLRQVDMKSLVAYSSIVHMGVVLGGVACFTEWGVYGGVMLMIGHGLCSSGLFYIVGVSYARSSSRSLLVNKGLGSIMPLISVSWFLLVMGNMAAPPSLNLVGEISLTCSVISWSSAMIISLMMLLFFSAVYSLYLYSYSQHGKSVSMMSGVEGVVCEHLVMFLHLLPLFFSLLMYNLC